MKKNVLIVVLALGAMVFTGCGGFQPDPKLGKCTVESNGKMVETQQWVCDPQFFVNLGKNDIHIVKIKGSLYEELGGFAAGAYVQLGRTTKTMVTNEIVEDAKDLYKKSFDQISERNSDFEGKFMKYMQTVKRYLNGVNIARAETEQTWYFAYEFKDDSLVRKLAEDAYELVQNMAKDYPMSATAKEQYIKAAKTVSAEIRKAYEAKMARKPL